jgi:hypothetical protein
MRLAFLAVALLAAILWRIPAGMVDLAVRRLTGDEVRLIASEGTLWHGHGVIEVVDRSSQRWQPWRDLDWSFDPWAPLRGRAAWKLISGRTEVARVEISASGWQLVHLRISGPARYFWQRLPHDFGRFGWAGDLALDSPAMFCTWQARCTGHLEVRWLNAGSDFLPERVLGDYLLQADGTAGDFALSCRTLAGVIRIDGTGHLPAEGKVSLRATVAGDPALLQRLTAIAGPWAKPGDTAGVWTITY